MGVEPTASRFTAEYQIPLLNPATTTLEPCAGIEPAETAIQRASGPSPQGMSGADHGSCTRCLLLTKQAFNLHELGQHITWHDRGDNLCINAAKALSYWPPNFWS